MKLLLRKLLSPLLVRLEAGDQVFEYKPSHRLILFVMSTVFFVLGIAVFAVSPGTDLSYFIPVILFSGGGFLGLLMVYLASDRAIAKIWGRR